MSSKNHSVGNNLVPNEAFLIIINLFDEIVKARSSILKRVIGGILYLPC